MDTISLKDRRLLMAGILCLMFSIASFGLSLSTIQGPILARMNGSSYFSIITVMSAIAVCVMTPIGGRLCDMIGGAKIITIFGTLAAACALVMAFVPNLWVFLIMRVLFSVASGSYSSLPYILVRQIYPVKEVPKSIGYITMMASVGGVAGSFLAGFFSDKGMLALAIAFPLVALIPAILLIGKYLKIKPTVPFDLDWGGIILLTLTLSGILVGLNNGPRWGWYSWQIIFCFFLGFGSLLGFIAWENKYKAPLMPMRIFMNREYSLILFVAFTLMFYMNGMNVYIPLAVQEILKAGTSVSGMLQIPKTLVTLVVPVAAGTWVVKKASNLWKSLAIAALFVIIPFGLLVFIGPKMPVWFIMLMLALTGISESFRAVGLLPAAQAAVAPSDIGLGTSLIGFIATLSGSIASAFFGLAYDSLSAKTAGMRGMIDGIDTICLLIALVGVIGLLLVILFLRPMMDKRNKAAAQAAAQK